MCFQQFDSSKINPGAHVCIIVLEFLGSNFGKFFVKDTLLHRHCSKGNFITNLHDLKRFYGQEKQNLPAKAISMRWNGLSKLWLRKVLTATLLIASARPFRYFRIWNCPAPDILFPFDSMGCLHSLNL